MAIRSFEDPTSLRSTITYDQTANLVSDAILREVVGRLADKFVDDHCDTIIAELDTTAITKMVAERVTARLVEKMIGVLNGSKS
jgi:hypothetical protein